MNEALNIGLGRGIDIISCLSFVTLVIRFTDERVIPSNVYKEDSSLIVEIGDDMLCFVDGREGEGDDEVYSLDVNMVSDALNMESFSISGRKFDSLMKGLSAHLKETGRFENSALRVILEALDKDMEIKRKYPLATVLKAIDIGLKDREGNCWKLESDGLELTAVVHDGKIKVMGPDSDTEENVFWYGARLPKEKVVDAGLEAALIAALSGNNRLTENVIRSAEYSGKADPVLDESEITDWF